MTLASTEIPAGGPRLVSPWVWLGVAVLVVVVIVVVLGVMDRRSRDRRSRTPPEGSVGVESDQELSP